MENTICTQIVKVGSSVKLLQSHEYYGMFFIIT